MAQFKEASARAKEREEASLKITTLAQWLTGRHRDAATTWRRSVSGIRSGTIIDFDLAGGVSDGLLLWYAAVTLKDDDLLNDAMEFFRELSAPERLSSIPGAFHHGQGLWFTSRWKQYLPKQFSSSTLVTRNWKACCGRILISCGGKNS